MYPSASPKSACAWPGRWLNGTNVSCLRSITSMVVILIIPIEEAPAEGLRILDAAEPLRKLGLIFKVLKWLSEKGGVVRSESLLTDFFTPRSAGAQQGSAFGLHRGAAVGM